MSERSEHCSCRECLVLSKRASEVDSLQTVLLAYSANRMTTSEALSIIKDFVQYGPSTTLDALLTRI